MTPPTTEALPPLETRLQQLLTHLQHILPAQAPLRDFVHHNTLHGFQHLPFPQALQAAQAVNGQYAYLSAETFRHYYQSGRITQADLEAVLDATPALQAGELLTPDSPDFPPLTRRAIYLAALTHPLETITPNQFIWQIEENRALETIQPEVSAANRALLLERAALQGLATEAEAISELWQACLQTLQLAPTLQHPETLLSQTPAPASNTDQQVFAYARTLLNEHLAQVGTSFTLRGLLQSLLGIDIMDMIRPQLIPALSAWLDQGMAAWQQHPPAADRQGFYPYWKQQARHDWGNHLGNVADWQEHLDSLPDTATTTIQTELQRIGIPETHWMDYLQQLALELPGWSGMFLWREQHPAYAGLPQPVAMLDYLAVRLVLEHKFARRVCREHWLLEANLGNIRGRFRRHPAEFMVRFCTFNRHLPEYLLGQARQMISRSRSGIYEDADWAHLAQLIWAWNHSPALNPDAARLPYDHGWRLFRLAQILGLDAARVHALPPTALDALFACLQTLDAQPSGYLWLQAYERHYRETLFTALAAQHLRQSVHPHPATRPSAQLIFCMDDREESLRRHLEEVNPTLETLGAAAFFNIPMNWRGLDDTTAHKLCPVPVTPVHQVSEQIVAEAAEQLSAHTQRQQQRTRLQNALQQVTRTQLLRGTLSVLSAAPGALAILLGKSFAARLFGQAIQRHIRRFELPVPTRVQFSAHATDPQRSAKQNQHGFTDNEQADLIADFLHTHGLVSGFSRLIILMGHYSSNQNNPHQAAYGCGACSGRYSGPNARTFAAMANRPAVRTLLAHRQLPIPADCWFIGAEHDTCSEAIRWLDADLLPTSLQADYKALCTDLEQACQRSAQERCRKLMSAPRAPTPEQALRHVQERALDYSEVRPELGHVANAAALIGRRAFSQGVFFDRRAFLISYDYRHDEDGEQLENILLNVAPVGAGISLEYYFSTVSNAYYGSGSKITHNISGLFGVLDGTQSDLRTGLPKQMIEIHEPMRLQLVLQAPLPRVQLIYARQPALQELIGNQWVLLAVKEPESDAIYSFVQGGATYDFVRWQAATAEQALPSARCSADYYQQHTGHLPPALIGAIDYA